MRLNLEKKKKWNKMWGGLKEKKPRIKKTNNLENEYNI